MALAVDATCEVYTSKKMSADCGSQTTGYSPTPRAAVGQLQGR